MTAPNDPARELALKLAESMGYIPETFTELPEFTEIIRTAFADALEDTARLDWYEANIERWDIGKPVAGVRTAIDAARRGEGEEPDDGK